MTALVEGQQQLPLIALVGPTGSGKTALAIAAAKKLREGGYPAEIISADAMQLYRGMDIGTAKATTAERDAIVHQLLDIWDPANEASVEEYQRLAREQIRDCHSRGVIALLVGGSGLYVSSVVYDFQFPGHDRDIRARLEEQFDASGIGPLAALLRQKDPEVANAVDLNNPRRVIRALEVMEMTGQAPSAHLEARGRWWVEPTLMIGLDAPREWLLRRIDQRVEKMWHDGLVEEVSRLREQGLGKTASQAIGYREVVELLDGQLSESDTLAQIAQHTKRYARKQMSWFRRDDNIRWVEPTSPSLVTDVSAMMMAAIDPSGQ